MQRTLRSCRLLTPVTVPLAALADAALEASAPPVPRPYRPPDTASADDRLVRMVDDPPTTDARLEEVYGKS